MKKLKILRFNIFVVVTLLITQIIVSNFKLIKNIIRNLEIFVKYSKKQLIKLYFLNFYDGNFRDKQMFNYDKL